MIAIIDYGMGNVRSLMNAFDYIGEEAAVTRDFGELDEADVGVGDRGAVEDGGGERRVGEAARPSQQHGAAGRDIGGFDPAERAFAGATAVVEAGELDRRPGRQIDRPLGAVRGRQDMLRTIVRCASKLNLGHTAGGDCLTQRGHPDPRRVLVHIGVDRIDGSLLDEVRRGEVGESLPKIDRAVLIGKRRHLREDGRVEAADAIRHAGKGFCSQEAVSSVSRGASSGDGVDIGDIVAD